MGPRERQDSEFEVFVRARTASLLRVGFLLTGDQHLAEDLVQTALARTHQSWGRLTEVGNAEAYTRKVMYHLQVSWWRRRRVAESPMADLPEARGADPTSGTALRLTVEQALCRLTPRQRAVIVLRFFEDLSETQTAAVLGCSVGTVKSQTSRSLARLRVVAPELLEHTDPTPERSRP
ncbi:MAG TPA: SigE family RNA polymerase sigma factor [Oryzihumus sp.]|nr:SigE family RNA polymerase sigma factor [Oryzihumus sp.]